MGISNANKAFATELFHLKRVVRNYVYGFDQLDLRDAQFEAGMKRVQLADVEVMQGFLLLQKIGRRDHDSDADDLLIERNEPCPMELARIEDQRVILVLLTSCAVIARRADHL